MNLKLKLGDYGLSVRVQTRTVTTTEIIKHGEVVARGEAVLNPGDKFDERVGAELSGARALGDFFRQAKAQLAGYPNGDQKAIAGQLIRRDLLQGWADFRAAVRERIAKKQISSSMDAAINNAPIFSRRLHSSADSLLAYWDRLGYAPYSPQCVGFEAGHQCSCGQAG